MECNIEFIDVSKKKPPVSSFKLLKSNATSKVASTPIKSTAATLSSKRDNCNIAATPTSSSNKHASLLSSADKRRSTPYKSVNFTPIRELNRLTASVMKKFESARASAGSSKASKDASLTPLRTPTMAYKKEMQMHTALTPLTEKKRNKTPLDLSSTGKNTASSKWRLLSTEIHRYNVNQERLLLRVRDLIRISRKRLSAAPLLII
ncbi:uncharacterized protein DS421_10g313830 [Arachis hypogaea]|nr:uncharacterized protein DS421_10g313830 [Arachis hypogaea]